MSREPGAARPRRRLVQLLVLGVVAVVAGLYAAAYVLAHDQVPQGTRIEGIDVGGLSPDEARERLERALPERGGAPMQVRAGGRTLRLSPAEVGLAVDVAASVEQVPVGAGWSPMHLWRVHSSSSRDYDAVVDATPALRRELQQLADQLGRAPTRGGIDFEADPPAPVYPRAGVRLDVADARAAVLDAYAAQERSVRVPIVQVQPRISRADVDRAVSEFALPAVSAPVTFTFDGGRVTLRPSQYADHLSTTVREGRLVPRVDRSWLAQRLDAALRRAGEAPRDATVRLVRGEPQVVPGRRGAAVAPRQAAGDFLTMLAADRGERTMTMPTVARSPETTTGTARDWGIRRVVSSFTTYYPHADYRNVNIGRAAELVDGTVLQPGETFSLNGTVGERTAENGFVRGFIISDGIFKEDYGGGVSQVATTLFNAAFFAGLEDVEHKPHSFYIDRYPVGREATVAWPTVDLRFRNDTQYGVLVDTSHTPSTFSSSGAITVRLWSTKVWDIEARTSDRYAFTSPQVRVLTSDDCVPNTGYEGFQVDVTRVFREAGESSVQRTERFHTTYTPSDTVVCE